MLAKISLYNACILANFNPVCEIDGIIHSNYQNADNDIKWYKPF